MNFDRPIHHSLSATFVAAPSDSAWSRDLIEALWGDIDQKAAALVRGVREAQLDVTTLSDVDGDAAKSA